MALTNQEKSSRVNSIRSLSTSKGNVSTASELAYPQDIDEQGLGQSIFEKLAQCKDKIHQVDATSGLTETNESIRLRATQVAMEMHSRGVKENDIVLICSKVHIDQTVAMLAILAIGAIAAPLDPEMRLEELKRCVLTLKPKLAFCDLRTCGQLEVIVRDSAEIPSCPVVSFGDHSDRLTFERFLLRKPNPDFRPVVVKDPKRRVAFVVATQGTGGPAKLVCISHRAVRMQMLNFGEMILKKAERVLSFLPMSGIAQVCLLCYCCESNLVRILPGVFNERSACKLIHDLRIDFVITSTDYAMRIARHPSLQDFDLSCMRVLYVGGAITTAVDISYLRSTFRGVKVFQSYGLTEMTGLVTGFSGDEYQVALERPSSVGKPMPGVKFKVVNFDTRETNKPDWWGELLLAGPTLMLGYYKDINGTNACIEKNYIKTGDVAQYDSEGYLYIHGRVSDHVIVGGHRFYPTEVEEVLLTHPLVREAVVLTDGKDLVACVIKQPRALLKTEDLMDFLSLRVPANKRPTKIKFMESFPKTTVGKIKRHSIKQAVLGITIVHSKSVVSFENSL